MFTIRKATIDDRSLIHDLASRIWENTYGKILSKEQLDYMFDMMYAPDNILKQMEELHHQYFIILADDMPAGYLSIEKTGENTYNFQKIYSLPEMHGTGIGRFIIEQAGSKLGIEKNARARMHHNQKRVVPTQERNQAMRLFHYQKCKERH